MNNNNFSLKLNDKSFSSRNATTYDTLTLDVILTAVYAVLQLSLTTQHSLYLMTDPECSRRLRPTNQRLPPV